MPSVQNGKPNNIADPLNLGRPILFDSGGSKIDLSKGSSGRKDPFDDNLLAGFKNFLAKYGVDIALIFLMVASGGSTIYNAIGAYYLAPYAGMILAAVVIAAGLIVECGFAWSWTRRGSTDLAGAQIKTNNSINWWSIRAMYLDIVLTISTLAFMLADYGVYWMMIGQPLVAARVVHLWFRLKGEHPETIADQAETTMKARARAAVILDAIQELKLNLLERDQRRQISRGKLHVRHEAETKKLWSGWYRRSIKRAVHSEYVKELPAGSESRIKALIPFKKKPKAAAKRSGK